jgi:hypothetical protein
MADNSSNPQPTAIDDVRRVREAIARQHQGNLREHMAETNRIFEQMQAKLKLKVVPPPADPRRSGTEG